MLGTCYGLGVFFGRLYKSKYINKGRNKRSVISSWCRGMRIGFIRLVLFFVFFLRVKDDLGFIYVVILENINRFFFEVVDDLSFVFLGGSGRVVVCLRL